MTHESTLKFVGVFCIVKFGWILVNFRVLKVKGEEVGLGFYI